MITQKPFQTDFGTVNLIGWLDETPRQKRPPLGLIPRFIRDEQRRNEILSAMTRYAEANKTIPGEWAEELKEIVERLAEREKRKTL